MMTTLLMAVAVGCAGPQPLPIAIDPQDEAAYVAHLNEVNMDGRRAFANWMAEERDTTPEEILAADANLDWKHNPFDAHKNAQAVSRGAVIYKFHCARCHGDDARGQGPSTLPDHPATSFKTFGKRLAATIHRGAPKKWARVIRDGSGDEVDYPDGRMTAMPPFKDKLTREQIWLVITYLQSLDRHARRASTDPHA